MHLKISGATAWAWLLTVLVIAPVVATLLDDRDVNALNFSVDVQADSPVVLAGRITVVLVTLLAAWVAAKSWRGLSIPSGNNTRANLLLVALLFFVLGHTVLPGLFGGSQYLAANALYGPGLLFVAYRAGRMSSSAPLASIRWALLLFVALGFIAMLIAPQMAMQTEEVPLRLPFIDFRYWGLGSNPNNVAPLALVLVFFLIYQPLRSLALTGVAMTLAGLTILFAQSQTTWMAALIVLPLYWFYRVLPKPVRRARVDPSIFVGMLVLTAGGLLMLLWQLAQIDYSMLTETIGQLRHGTAANAGEGLAGDSLLARVEIWQVAIEAWRDNFWFGYGPAAWDTEFRLQVGMPYAYSAHNQLMQSISVGGAVGLASLLFYMATLTYLSFKTATQSHGLTVALLALIILRGITETPLDTDTLLSGELLIHLLLIYLLAVFLWRKKPFLQTARSRHHRHARGSSRAQARKAGLSKRAHD